MIRTKNSDERHAFQLLEMENSTQEEWLDDDVKCHCWYSLWFLLHYCVQNFRLAIDMICAGICMRVQIASTQLTQTMAQSPRDKPPSNKQTPLKTPPFPHRSFQTNHHEYRLYTAYTLHQ